MGYNQQPYLGGTRLVLNCNRMDLRAFPTFHLRHSCWFLNLNKQVPPKKRYIGLYRCRHIYIYILYIYILYIHIHACNTSTTGFYHGPGRGGCLPCHRGAESARGELLRLVSIYSRIPNSWMVYFVEKSGKKWWFGGTPMTWETFISMYCRYRNCLIRYFIPGIIPKYFLTRYRDCFLMYNIRT